MASTSLLVGLLNQVCDAHSNEKKLPEWFEPMVESMENGSLVLTSEESQPSYDKADWPVFRWISAYLSGKDRSEDEATPDLARRLLKVLLEQTTLVKDWRAQGCPSVFDEAEFDLRQLDTDLRYELADSGQIWLDGFSVWTDMGAPPFLAAHATALMLTALPQKDALNVRKALDLGANPNAHNGKETALMLAETAEQVQLLLDAGARPDQASPSGEYAEDAWWRKVASSYDETLPPEIEQLRVVTLHPDPLGKIENVLAYLPKYEWEDRLARVGLAENAPWKNRSWAEWHAISAWNRYAEKGDGYRMVNNLFSGRPPQEYAKTPWSGAVLKMVSSDKGHPPWKQVWRLSDTVTQLEGDRYDKMGEWLDSTPELEDRQTLALKVLTHLLRQSDEACAQDPTDTCRVVAWLDRATPEDPSWHSRPYVGESRTREMCDVLSAVAKLPALTKLSSPQTIQAAQAFLRGCRHACDNIITWRTEQIEMITAILDQEAWGLALSGLTDLEGSFEPLMRRVPSGSKAKDALVELKQRAQVYQREQSLAQVVVPRSTSRRPRS